MLASGNLSTCGPTSISSYRRSSSVGVSSTGTTQRSKSERNGRISGDWERASGRASDILDEIAATQEEQLLPIEYFGDFWPKRERPSLVEEALRRGIPLHEMQDRRRKEHDEWLRGEFRAGRGLEVQRQFVATSLLDFLSRGRPNDEDEAEGTPVAPVWDSKGRRVEARARGVREIVATQLLAVFAAPELGLFLCSMCGRAFAVDPEERRPRRGVRRFCSDDCRREAKLESNRASWHKNKQKWTKGSGSNG